MLSKEQEKIKRKKKKLWVIDKAILKQLKYQRSATSREMSNLLDWPTRKDQPKMSSRLQILKKAGLLNYNKKTKRYSVSSLGKKVRR